MGLLSFLDGHPEDAAMPYDRNNVYDAFGRLQSIYQGTGYKYAKDDPTVNYLNKNFSFLAPSTQRAIRSEDDLGTGTAGQYGMWDLGNGKTLLPIRDARYEIDPSAGLSDGTIGFLQQFNNLAEKQTNEDGSFNPDGWRVADLEKESRHAGLGHIAGIASVLAPAVGGYLFGATGGVGADIAAGSDGMMIGASGTTATAGTGQSLAGQALNSSTTSGTAAPSGVSGEWSSINGDAGLNSYVNGGINTNYNNFGLGSSAGIAGDASLNGYTSNALNGVNIGDGTYSGVPSADTSYNAPNNSSSNSNSDMLKQAAKAMAAADSGATGGGGLLGDSGSSGGQASSFQSLSPYTTQQHSANRNYGGYLSNIGQSNNSSILKKLGLLG